MNIRISHVYTFALIALLSLFAPAARAGAQDIASKQLKGSAKLVARTGKNRKGRAADSSSHSYIILYTFCPGGLPCPGGGNSFAGLLRDAAGNLYGTVAYGGANFPDGGPNGGTVFSVDNPGQETVLYSFCSQSDCADGSVPAAGLIRTVQATCTEPPATGVQAPAALLNMDAGPCSSWTVRARRRCFTASALRRTARTGAAPAPV